MANTPRKPNQKPQTAEERRAAADARRAAAARQGTSVGTGSGRGGGASAPGSARGGGADRNRYLLFGGIGLVILVVAIVAAIQAFSGDGKKDVSKISTVATTGATGSTGGATTDSGAVVGGVATVDGLIGNVPQSGNVLGQANAPVTVVEYVDLLCPVCADYSENGFNDIVNDYVSKGTVKVQFEYYPVIYLNNSNPSDEVAVGAFEAAKKQNKLFTMALLWYRNQGGEADNYASDQYVNAIAQAAGIDLTAFAAARKTVNGKSYIAKAAAAGQKVGVSGTPTAIVVDKAGKRSSPLSAAAVPAAIKAALKG